MSETPICPECSAPWKDGITCLDHFHQMLAWEFEHPTRVWAVHHLTVLCFNLQHPSNYSPEALIWAKNLLVRYVVDGVTPQQIRSEQKQSLDSGNRTHQIGGTPESHGVYAHPVSWTTTVGDVTASGLDDHYCERVEAWAQSVYEVLLASGNDMSA